MKIDHHRGATVAAAQGHNSQQETGALEDLQAGSAINPRGGRSRREAWMQKATALGMALGTEKEQMCNLSGSGPGARHGGVSSIPGINPNSWSLPLGACPCLAEQQYWAA